MLKFSDAKIVSMFFKKHGQNPAVYALTFITIAVTGWLLTPSTPAVTEGPEHVRLDEQIPSGFRLVPITASNSSALQAVLIDFGLVDLYSGPRLVAKAVKIIPSPENAEVFNALVPEQFVREFLQIPMPVHVVVRNRRESKTTFELVRKVTAATSDVQIEVLGESGS